MKTRPRYKVCRSLGDSVFAQCETPKFQVSKAKKQDKRRGRGRGGRGRMRSEYGMQLREKQKVRYSYNISEKQLGNYVKRARAGDAQQVIEFLYSLLEQRLDNTIYRLGIVPTRQFARQVVGHGHILVNGKRVAIPSYQVRKGDEIQIRPQSLAKPIFSDLKERLKKEGELPGWIKIADKTPTWSVVNDPIFSERREATLDFDSVMEFYSRV